MVGLSGSDVRLEVITAVKIQVKVIWMMVMVMLLVH
jgi:hypothetical protein